MKEATSAITDFILLCAWLVIGTAMLVTSWSNISASVISIQQEDKTALRNYTGLVEDSFYYTGRDVILAIVIGDQYEPDIPKLKVHVDATGDTLIDARPTEDPNNYVNQDRYTFISNIWSGCLKSFNNTNPATFSRLKENGEYIWYVTQ